MARMGIRVDLRNPGKASPARDRWGLRWKVRAVNDNWLDF